MFALKSLMFYSFVIVLVVIVFVNYRFLWQLNKHPQMKIAHLDRQACAIPMLMHRMTPGTEEAETVCQRLPPRTESCEIADKLFKDKPKASCSNQARYDFCKIKYDVHDIPRVLCDCDQCSNPFELGVIDPANGKLLWHHLQGKEQLEKEIRNLLESRGAPRHFGFVFIKSFHKNFDKDSRVPYDSDLHLYYAMQLLILPPNVHHYVSKAPPKESPPPNVNLIFIDSLSRHHFYRSLPQTVQLFSQLNKESSTKVLDFKLVQGVRSRTFENFQALFSGIINTSKDPFGTNDMPPEALRIQELFGKFQDHKYQTLWLEDVCMFSSWGITKDLLVYNQSTPMKDIWTKLHLALKKAGISAIDLTLSSCEIMSMYKFQNPFYDMDSICFNGRYQHEYFLEYLQVYQRIMSTFRLPFLTFFENNVVHENTGRRVQTLDHHLKNYVEFASQQENMLTIIFSDHGNSYGDFLQGTEEGQVELYQPSMFFVVPKKVATYLGVDQMNNLMVNQDRLVSLLDLHYALTSLVSTESVPKRNVRYLVTPSGLFGKISENRTCHDMPMIMPNLCICNGFESSVTSNSDNVVYAHYALGKINNKIQDEYHQGHRTSLLGFGNCKQLILSQHSDVKISMTKDSTIVKMNLLVPPGNSFSSKHDVFFVTLSIKNGQQGDIILQNIDRSTPYSRYKTCSDSGVTLSFCVCDKEKRIPLSQSHSRELLLMQTEIHPFRGVKCLYLNSGMNENSFVLYVTNDCRYAAEVTISFKSENTHLFSPKLIMETVHPGQERCLSAGMKFSPGLRWFWTYHAEYKFMFN